jgi:alpha-tubulin suppressor-like RCC1 family protein
VTTATPPGGQYFTGVTVSLNCSDGPGGSGCDKIYYTLDGTIPTTASPVYSSPLPMAEGGTILRYFAVDKAGNTETVKTQNYILDSLPPVTTAMPPGGAYGTGQTVTLTCNDGAGSGCDRIYYTLDNTTPTTSSPVYAGPLTMAAPMILRYFSTDYVGNAEAVRTETYLTDNTPPTTTASPAGGTYYLVSVRLTCNDGTGSGCDTIYYTLDNTTPTTSSPVYVTLLPITTTSTLRYFAVDRAGNPEPVKSATYVIDKTAPMVTAVSPPDGGTPPASTTITATFSEPMNPATITSGSFTVSRFVGFKAIATRGSHTVALKNNGTVVAWGWNIYGQCNVPTGLSGVAAIDAGGYHTVALKNDGTVVAWGDNRFGQCNIPPGLSGIVAVAATDYNTVALKNDGTVVAWGDDGYGLCTVPPGLSGVVAIGVADAHAVALKSDGSVITWGQYAYPVPVEAQSGVIAIAAASSHVVALKNDGTVFAWGWNDFGECDVPPGLSGVVAIAAGYEYTVVLKNDGTVVAWGANNYGQSTVPEGLSGGIAISAGDYHTAVLKNDGTAVIWGENWSGESSVPQGISGISSITRGDGHTVALKNDGTVIAWGLNNYGQSTVPPGLSGAIAVAATGWHTVG